MSSEDALPTLRFVIPGFVFLKLIYLLGFRIRRTNLEWAVWSLLASFPIATVTGVMVADDSALWGVIAVLLAVATGAVAGVIVGWVLERQTRLRENLQSTAWDAILSQSGWVVLETTDGKRIHGEPSVVAESGATDHPDIYLRRPSFVGDEPWPSADDLDGILVRANQISTVKVFHDQQAMDRAREAANAAPVPDA